jgi:hypothetical protein
MTAVMGCGQTGKPPIICEEPIMQSLHISACLLQPEELIATFAALL